MRVVLGGVRGSNPRAHPDFMQFGGATSCVLVEEQGTCAVLDAGTGLRAFAGELGVLRSTPPLLLFTHYHLDHVIGLPSFAPLYDPGWSAVLAAPDREGVSVETAVERLTAAPFWPVTFRARIRFERLPDECPEPPCRHGALEVRWCAVRHRNGCHAYRLDAAEAGGASMALVTDLEWTASSALEQAALLYLLRRPRPVDLLLIEGYDAAAHPDAFGHSAWRETLGLARAAGARRVVVTHHAPEDTDRSLTRREAEVQNVFPGARFGRDGMIFSWRGASESPEPV